MSKKLARLMSATAMLASTMANAEPSSIRAYLDCARATGVAINQKFTVIPAKPSGGNGLFVYTDQGAYFLPLGTPQSTDSRANEYFIATEISGLGEVYLFFREERPGSRSDIHSAIGYQLTPPRTDDSQRFRFTPAREVIGDQGRAVLSKQLQEKVATIKSFVEQKNSYFSSADAKLAFEKDRVIYLAKLEKCRIAGDRALTSLVGEEQRKLQSGFPGATIWETQLDGKRILRPGHRLVSLTD